MNWNRARRIATPDPVAPVPAPTPAGATGLTQHQRDCLAVALHTRWHGDHTPIRGSKADCAALAGAYDDVAAIESLIVAWIRGD